MQMNIMFIFIFVGFVFKWGVDYNLFFFHFLNKDPFCLDTIWLNVFFFPHVQYKLQNVWKQSTAAYVSLQVLQMLEWISGTLNSSLQYKDSMSSW